MGKENLCYFFKEFECKYYDILISPLFAPTVLSATLILNLISSEFDVFEIEDNKMDIEYFVLETITVNSPGKSIISVLNLSVPKNELFFYSKNCHFVPDPKQ